MYKAGKEYLSFELHKYTYLPVQTGTQMLTGMRDKNTILNSPYLFVENVLYTADIPNFIVSL